MSDNRNLRDFSIVGAKGNLLEAGSWRSDPTKNIAISINDASRTVIKNVDAGPVYLVFKGTTADFKKLGAGNGHAAKPTIAWEVYSRVWHSPGITSKLILAEYDASKNRTGQTEIPANHHATYRPGAAVSYVLLMLRLSGKGTIAFTDLYANQSSDVEHAIHDSKLTLAPLPRLVEKEQIESNPLRKNLDSIISLAHEAKQEIESLTRVESMSVTNRAIDNRDSRSDSPISASRERFVRSLLTDMAAHLPVSNGSHHHAPAPVTMAIVADESMFNYYKDSCTSVIYLSPSNYEEALKNNKIDVFVYVSSWKGLNQREWTGVKYRQEPKEALENILRHCQDENIPTIFQTIEDPSNYDYFLSVARKFDVVFTSDEDCIDRYKSDLDHDRVFYGEYGANVHVNNPIGSFRHDLPRALFSGSYPTRYKERTADMEIIFSSVLERSECLTIVDRNFDSDEFRFPNKYQENIIGSLPHELLQRVHKLFRYSVNFNSIKNSTTMCAMRVYELQAQGKTIWSNYARSVYNKFPHIRIVPEVTALETDRPGIDLHYEKSLAQDALNLLLRDKTHYQLVGDMLSTIGLPRDGQRSNKILVVAAGNALRVRASVLKQLHVDTEVITEHEFSARLVDLSKYGYIAVMSDQYEYGKYYLLGRLNAFRYTNSMFVSQEALFEGEAYRHGPVHEFINSARYRELTVFSTEYIDSEATKFLRGETDRFSGVGYATDPYSVNFNSYRALIEQEVGDHSGDSILTVVVPVYNNGKYLETKCLPSIQRNRKWRTFRIMLVDDGSTDSETLDICKELEESFPNIELIQYRDGGSGSASRPRNRGIRECKTELVTFLDPDNEVSDGGYDALVQEYVSHRDHGRPVDFVSGYQVKVDARTSRNGVHADGPMVFVENPRVSYFDRGRFPVVSTQACVLRTQFLRTAGIEFVEGAAGQDTLFGWEVLANAQAAGFTNSAWIIYYAQRSDSVTNSVDVHYFEKSFKLESVMIERLSELKLLDLYKESHLDDFVSGWYLQKLMHVDSGDYNVARGLLERIVNLYGRQLSEFEVHSDKKGI